MHKDNNFLKQNDDHTGTFCRCGFGGGELTPDVVSHPVMDTTLRYWIISK
jgi:hypothetical protein